MIKLAKYSMGYRSKLIIDCYKKWLRKGDKVLDVGCGNGIVSRELQTYFRLAITGCDIQNYLKYKIPFTQMLSEDSLPFKGKTFDVIMFNDVLHHTAKENQQKLIKDALRVADKVLIFEVQPTLWGKTFDYILNNIHYKNLNIPFTFRTNEEWVSLFANLQAKYEMQKVRKPFFYPFLHTAFCVMNSYED